MKPDITSLTIMNTQQVIAKKKKFEVMQSDLSILVCHANWDARMNKPPIKYYDRENAILENLMSIGFVKYNILPLLFFIICISLSLLGYANNTIQVVSFQMMVKIGRSSYNHAWKKFDCHL